MNGFNVSEGGHQINIIPPASYGGGVVSQAFNMGLSEHVSICIQIGAVGASMPTSIQLVANSSIAASQLSPPSGTAIPFRGYINKGVGGTSQDLLSPPVYYVAAGILAANLNPLKNQMIWIELDSAELDFLGDSDNADFPYLQVVITNGAFPTVISAVAVMSGLRQAYQGGGQTATV